MNSAAPSVSERLVTLDVLRGLSILGIFFINIAFMGNSIFWWPDHPELLGWHGMDGAVYHLLRLFVDGTQRGMFQLLFGASVVILASSRQIGAGMFYRRYAWLLLFGLFDVFVIGWDGDFLHPYALVAMVVFPLRNLQPRLLLVFGLMLMLWGALAGGMKYEQRQSLQERVVAAQTAQAHHAFLTAEQGVALKAWQSLDEAAGIPDELRQAERQAHVAGTLAIWNWYRDAWFELQQDGLSFDFFKESLAMVLIGMALFRWGITQGLRSRRFYFGLLVIGYGFGLMTRAIDFAQLATFSPVPRLSWITEDLARLAVTLGNMGLLHLVLSSEPGRSWLRVFKAPGRIAFTLYFTESVLGNWLLFSPLGLNLWGRWGWAGLSLIALVVAVVLLLAANLWMRTFVIGPFEWVWRSLIAFRMQAFRRCAVPAATTANASHVA